MVGACAFEEVFDCSDEASAKAVVDAEMPVDGVPLFVAALKTGIKDGLILSLKEATEADLRPVDSITS